jgi:hypothetical protein
MRKKFDKDAEWLREQYAVKGRSALNISRELRLDQSTITYWLKKYGIDIHPAGQHLKGKKLSEEHIQKLKTARKGRTPMLGKTHSDETKARFSEMRRRENLSDETRQKMSAALMGNTHGMDHIHSEEHKKKISESLKGNTYRLGIPHTTETRKKISSAVKGEKNGMYGVHLYGPLSPTWKGGKSYEPYCHKFNKDLKASIKEKFGRKCYLCGIQEDGFHLCVHHTDYNKGQGCGKAWSLVVLCPSCHSKSNWRRYYYFNLLSNYWASNSDINFNSDEWFYPTLW